jgi:DNA repair photolyase
MFSGVTDCYQPAERRFRLTRGCLDVACEARQPVAIITKNTLVSRDIDLLSEMSQHNAISVAISVTTLDEKLARTMEPRTSTPAARLRTVSELSAAGVRTHVMVAPVIPGLNDSEIPRILEDARDAGADAASFILLRLPLTVEPVFVEWLRRIEPNRAERVETRLRASRGGYMSDSRFGKRMRGEG